MKISHGKRIMPQRIVIYGPEGIGKTTLASHFPNPLFIDTEGGSFHLEIRRFEEQPASWAVLQSQVEYVLSHHDICSTLVIDTADWAEALAKTYLCQKNNWTSIGQPGYGQGYLELEREFGKFLNLLTQVMQKGKNVVLLAHATMRKFEQPDEIGAYDRYELKLEKKTAALMKEWADAIIFLNYQTFITNKDNKTKIGKATGGQRIMYLNHRPTLDAKNRWGLEEEYFPLSYEVIRPFIYGEDNNVMPQRITEVDKGIPETYPKEVKKIPDEKPPFTQEAAIDPILQQILQAEGFTVEDIMAVIYAKGIFPQGTPFSAIPKEWITANVIGRWEGLKPLIIEMKQSQKIAY